MAKCVGTALSVKELIEILATFPPELPVRVRTISHEWPVSVYKHELCLTLES